MNQIFQHVEADIAVSVSELKRNAATVIAASQEQPVAILNHNRVVAYLVSPEVWERAQDLHEDAKIVLQRLHAGADAGLCNAERVGGVTEVEIFGDSESVN